MRDALLTLAMLACIAVLCALSVFKILSGAEHVSALKIIREKCLPCHSGDKPPNGLRLDSVDNMIRGGKHGPVLVIYEPEASLMYKFMAAGKMPPMGNPLTADELAAIKRWILGGAHQFDMSGREP